ncbi:hypothetical protein [Streptomyces sp. NPDC017520]
MLVHPSAIDLSSGRLRHLAAELTCWADRDDDLARAYREWLQTA